MSGMRAVATQSPCRTASLALLSFMQVENNSFLALSVSLALHIQSETD